MLLLLLLLLFFSGLFFSSLSLFFHLFILSVKEVQFISWFSFFFLSTLRLKQKHKQNKNMYKKDTEIRWTEEEKKMKKKTDHHWIKPSEIWEKKWIEINKQRKKKEKKSRENENINHFNLVFHFDFDDA